MDIQAYMHSVGRAARAASGVIATAPSEVKNYALKSIAEHLDGARRAVLAANQSDLNRACRQDLDSALIDRLELNDQRIDAMLEGLSQVIELDDPIGVMTKVGKQPSGIQLSKMSVPIGVVGIIYASRPNVTIDAASLCITAGNAGIPRGGSEAIQSNPAIAASTQISL